MTGSDRTPKEAIATVRHQVRRLVDEEGHDRQTASILVAARHKIQPAAAYRAAYGGE